MMMAHWSWRVVGIEAMDNLELADPLVRLKLSTIVGKSVPERRIDVSIITTFAECPKLGDLVRLHLVVTQ